MSSFWFKTKSVFSSLLQHLINFMTPITTEILFPQQPIPVESYQAAVIGTCVYVRPDKDHEDANNYSVKEIRLYKCRSHPYHEYIIVQVTYQKRPGYLRIERTRSRPEEVKEEEFLKRLPITMVEPFRAAFEEATLDNSDDSTVEETTYPSLAPPIKTSSTRSSQNGSLQFNSYSQSSASLKNLNGKPAIDTVIGVNQESFKDDDLLVVLQLKDLPLARLVCLAKIVHDEDPMYSIFFHQCYWYANLIIKVIEKEARKISKAKEIKDKIDILRLVRPRGTWWHIPVGRVEKEMVEMISVKFEQTWEDLSPRLTNLVTNNGNAARQDSGWAHITDGEDELEENLTVAELRAKLAKETRAREDLEKRLQALEQPAQDGSTQ